MRLLFYLLSRPIHYFSIAYHDILFKIVFSILVLKLLLFTYIAGLGKESFIPSLGFILALSSFSLLIQNRGLKLFYLLSLDLFCSFLFITHSLYLSYFDDFASLYHLNQVHQLDDVSDIVVKMINIELLFIVDLLFLPFLLLKLKTTGKYNMLERSKALIFLLIVSLYLNISFLTYYKQYYSTIFFRYDFVKYTGIFNYQMCDIYDFLFTKIQQGRVSPSDINKVEDWFEEKLTHRSAENNLTGIGKGKNLIMIQVESLQNFVIGRSYHGRQITPNLNRLVKGGIYFNNIFDQTAAGNSSDATLLANSSLFPSRKGAVAYLYFQNYFDSLPKMLCDEGYATATLHAYKKNFWNSLAFEKSLGFEYQFYEDTYVITDIIGGRLKGLSDRSFFLQSIGKIKQLPTPFYAFLRTLSTHALFDHITKDIDDFPLYDLEGEILGSYLRSMHYVDSALGEFLHRLSENNLASNTIVVVYGDHRTRLPLSDMKRIGVNDINEERKVPLIIHIPDKELGIESGKTGGLIDFAPTLCNILGINISDKYFLGRDLANSHEDFVVFRDGTFIDNNDSMDKMSAQRQLMISDLILEKDMISFLKNR